MLLDHHPMIAVIFAKAPVSWAAKNLLSAVVAKAVPANMIVKTIAKVVDNVDLVRIHAKARVRVLVDRDYHVEVQNVEIVVVVRTDVRIARLRAKTRVKIIRVLKLLVQRFLIFII